ncbi:uncharacterized protein LOC106378438 [Brassica napus]|uniref:uncharacterized protein LOC106378438 n=1 Tax=Brassica napus TaxID=3708 RepID=UPI0020794290|nr:uncharacterized protein LOC106378438 [Brassica napus]
MRKTQREDISDSFDWIKDIWTVKCSPKVKLFLWSIAQEALPLGEALQRRGIQAEALCVKLEVWKSIPLKQVVHLATGCDFKRAVVAFRKTICLPPSGITTSILPWVCWALWVARNTHIFEKRIFTPTEVATKALRLAREWINAQLSQPEKNSALPTPLRSNRSGLEMESLPVCKSDAAFHQQSNRAGLAWIIRDASGNPLQQGSMTHELVNSPLVAEALALRAGLISAVTLELPKLKMLSDNATLIRAINNDAQIKEIYGIVKDIQQIASVFVEITFNHVPRSFNGEADCLAKLSLYHSVSSVTNP